MTHSKEGLLGLHVADHDSTAALWIDDRLVLAIEEEKLSGHKHAGGVPINALREVRRVCLEREVSIARIGVSYRPFRVVRTCFDTRLSTTLYTVHAVARVSPLLSSQSPPTICSRQFRGTSARLGRHLGFATSTITSVMPFLRPVRSIGQTSASSFSTATAKTRPFHFGVFEIASSRWYLRQRFRIRSDSCTTR